MPDFKQIKPAGFTVSPFEKIGEDWMLITTRKGTQVNTMTASWGGLGVMWGKNVAAIVLRPSRLTKEFVDAADSFSLSFFDRTWRKQLTYLGTVSGRDEPKIANSGLTVIDLADTPAFAEASQVLVCRKIYHQVVDPAGFLDADIDRNYPIKDYHTLYLGEVLGIYTREG